MPLVTVVLTTGRLVHIPRAWWQAAPTCTLQRLPARRISKPEGDLAASNKPDLTWPNLAAARARACHGAAVTCQC